MENKNILVVYKGGGYSGCFWEWNFFSYDKTGKFFNLFTSGRNGIKKESDAEALLSTVPSERGSRDDIYVYDLTKESEVEEFQEESAVPLVVGIVKGLTSGKYGEYDGEIFFRCDKCGEKVSDGQCEDWHGCGGIAMTADTKICDECNSINTCEDCGEYSESVEANGGLCSDCAQNRIDAIINELDDEDMKYLEYNQLMNTMTAIDISESEVADEVKAGRGDQYWVVTVDTKKGIQKYVIEADSEYVAIDDGTNFLDRQYYTAEADKLSDMLAMVR